MHSRGLAPELIQVRARVILPDPIRAGVARPAGHPPAFGVAVEVDPSLRIEAHLAGDAFEHQGGAQGGVPISRLGQRRRQSAPRCHPWPRPAAGSPAGKPGFLRRLRWRPAHRLAGQDHPRQPRQRNAQVVAR